MISGDNAIMDIHSEAHRRMRWYANMCDELYVVALCSNADEILHDGNLFCYPASGNPIARRIKAYRTCRGIAKRKSIDIITAQAPDELGLIAYAIARSFGMGFQLQMHTDIMSPWYRRAGVIPRIKYMLARFFLPRADCVRVVSKRIAMSLINELGIDSSVISVLPIFTDVRQFIAGPSSEAKKTHVGKSSAYRMIAVGRFVDKEKNFRMLICAMREVVSAGIHATLTIVGDGPDKAYYESLIHALDLDAHVFLKLWQSDMPRVYHSFDLCVIPSYIEGWGRVAIEALASGLPVIMTDVGLANDLVRDGVNGRVIPVADRGSLADAIIDFCRSAEQRTTLTRGAKDSARHLASATSEDYLIQWKESFTCCRVKTL